MIRMLALGWIGDIRAMNCILLALIWDELYDGGKVTITLLIRRDPRRAMRIAVMPQMAGICKLLYVICEAKRTCWLSKLSGEFSVHRSWENET